jgi:hypothetical protein
MAASLPEAATSGEEDQRGNEKKETIESEPRFPKKRVKIALSELASARLSIGRNGHRSET